VKNGSNFGLIVVTRTTFGCPDGAFVNAGGNGAAPFGGYDADDPNSLDSAQMKNRSEETAASPLVRGIRRRVFIICDRFGLEAYGGG
jgi:hypothetical protein